MSNDLFKNKPTKQEVTRYEAELNRLLSAHNVTMHIELSELPTKIESFVSGKLYTEYLWIESVTAKLPQQEIKVRGLFSEHASNKQGYFDKKYAWSDALQIQGEIYEKLGKLKALKTGTNDPYWKLWDLIDA